ncbi:MAG: hypothetical protein OEV73_09470, partial [Desulfobulbaceae bacterium]|nr:hypothetical protein [Desulfobulbaceae bacterium]
RHTLTLSETAHRPTETLADIAAAKHVECTDCHNPHAAGHTKHTKGIVGGNAIVTNSSPLYKATGIVPTYTGIDPNWGNNTIEYGSYSAIQAVDKEYQICFKCHTRANLNVESWGTTPPASYAWTDVGMEFNPLNKSHHPVVSALTGSGSSKLTATQLSTPWAANAGTQTMYCTDCHESDSTIAGPHGSATKWILAGTNKAWPYTLKSKNGRNDTTVYRTLDTMESDLGTEEGLFCRNCHPNTKSSSINSAHSRTNHTTTKCVDCHIRIPHGGRVSRLIAADNSDTYTMPARYTSDGAGLNTGGTNVPYVKEFIKAASGAGYNAVNCTTSSGCTGGSGHTTTSNGGEEW